MSSKAHSSREMDPQKRRAHVRYFRKCLDFGFSAHYTALDTSRMSLIYFCVVALDLLGALEEVCDTKSNEALSGVFQN